MRRGWSNNSGATWVGIALVACVAMVAVTTTSGCSSKKKPGFAGEELGGQPSTGFNDAALAGAPSIEQFEETGAVAAGGSFHDVHFAFDSDQLDQQAQAAVQYNASVLQQDPTLRVEIEGHCDERGSAEYNLALGARRARAVRDALVGLGIGSERMSTVSFGEELPLCKESTEACWATNRRAHFVTTNR
jgi:peptidoglycan-associated lipoprotein